MRRALFVLGVAALLGTPAARADDPQQFGTPVTIAPGELVGSGVALDGTAAALVKDALTEPGHVRLLDARRPATVNAWTQPEVVADEPGGVGAAYGRDPVGGEIAAWLPSDSTTVHFRTRGALDVGFGETTDVPLPPRRAAAPGSNVVENSRDVHFLSAARATDGAVAIAACESDYRVGNGDGAERMLLYFKPPVGDGSWQTLGGCYTRPQLGTDALGGIDLLWGGSDQPGPTGTHNVVWSVHRAPGKSAFGGRVAVSDPGGNATNGVSSPSLLTAPTGTAYALWVPVPTGGGAAAFGGVATIARRSLDGRWSPPEPASPSDDAIRPSLAVNSAGAAAVVWSTVSGYGGALAPPGGPFASPFSLSPPAGAVEQMPTALDAFGDVVFFPRRLDSTPLVLERRVDGSQPPPVAFLPPNTIANLTQMTTDPFGNGLVISSAVTNRIPRVVAVPYSAAPPGVGNLQLTPDALTFQLGAPARVGLQALAGSKSARQTTSLKAGRVRIAFDGRVKALLKRHRARLVLRARNAGPAVRTVKATVHALNKRR